MLEAGNILCDYLNDTYGDLTAIAKVNTILYVGALNHRRKEYNKALWRGLLFGAMIGYVLTVAIVR